MKHPPWLVFSITSRYLTKPSSKNEVLEQLLKKMFFKEREHILKELEERKEEKEDQSERYFYKWADKFRSDDIEKLTFNPWLQDYVDGRYSRPNGDLYFDYNGDRVYAGYLCHHGDVITGDAQGRRLGNLTFVIDWRTKFYKA